MREGREKRENLMSFLASTPSLCLVIAVTLIWYILLRSYSPSENLNMQLVKGNFDVDIIKKSVDFFLTSSVPATWKFAYIQVDRVWVFCWRLPSKFFLPMAYHFVSHFFWTRSNINHHKCSRFCKFLRSRMLRWEKWMCKGEISTTGSRGKKKYR